MALFENISFFKKSLRIKYAQHLGAGLFYVEKKTVAPVFVVCERVVGKYFSVAVGNIEPFGYGFPPF